MLIKLFNKDPFSYTFLGIMRLTTRKFFKFFKQGNVFPNLETKSNYYFEF
jgi:hypothetical protein